ncbi:hydrophobic surface binding protein A-domain-containing protein [Flammula alnicola]|nr:hydrophobic surface binding protein A-domain-containing protein [Flammula alnicola]
MTSISRIFIFTILASASLALVAAIPPPGPATVDHVINDLNHIKNQTLKLDMDVQALQLDGPVDFITIGSDSAMLLNIIATATSDVKALPQLSDADGIVLLPVIQNVKTAFQYLLTDILYKKPVIDNFGDTAIVVAFLQDAGTATVALVNAMKNAAPASLQAVASDLEGQVKETFTTVDRNYDFVPNF